MLQALALEIGEGASTGILESDSSNVVELVEGQYNVCTIILCVLRAVTLCLYMYLDYLSESDI